MPYLPTRCDSCRRAALVSVGEFQSTSPRCARCGEPLRAIPGCVYTSADVEQFHELSEIVAEGCISAEEARHLNREMARALWAESQADMFESLSARFPGMLPLQLVIGRNLNAQRRIFRMLHTIFEGLTSHARPDGASIELA